MHKSRWTFPLGDPLSMMNQIANSNGASAEAQAVINSILSIVRERTGRDFSCYRPATVYRRILNRMISVGVETLSEYLDLLRTHDDEGLRLLERVTIKVSRFYRNAATFEILRRQLLPDLERARGARPLRVWSAGCGCGEEAYSLAMVLEELGAPGLVAASDIDPAALVTARRGVYPEQAATELPEDLAARFLAPAHLAGQRAYRVRDGVRRRVAFSIHDLTSSESAPEGGRFDLVCCRNVLIYLRRDVQARALRRIAAAIDGDGYLCLGEAEWPDKTLGLEAFGRKTHIFRLPEARPSGETL